MKTGIIRDTTIALRKPISMSTGYRGRGIIPKSITVPAETWVRYIVKRTLSGEYHTVEYKKGGMLFTASVIK